MGRGKFQQWAGVRGKMSSILEMLNLRYRLDTQIEISNRQLDEQVWDSGERSKLKIKFGTLLSIPEWINFSSPAPITQQGGGIVSKFKSVLENIGDLYHCTSEYNVSEFVTQLQEFRFYPGNSGEGATEEF